MTGYRQFFLRLVIAAVFLSAVAPLSAADIAGPTIPQAYVKKATWPETMVATRAKLSKVLARQRDAMSGVKLGPWYTTGALPAEEFGVVLFPEKGVDLNAKKLWRERPEWVDGKVHYLESVSPASTYLFRIITADEPVSLTAGLGSNDGLELWLNGEKLISRNISRTTAPDQDKVGIDLRAGENKLLMKVYNRANVCGFYFSVQPGVSLSIWRQIEKDYPGEAASMTNELPKGRHLEWFSHADSTKFERKAIEHMLGDIGPAADPLRRRFEKLCSSNASPEDPQWLGLWTEVSIFREVLANFKELKLGSLRRAVDYLSDNYPDQYKNGKRYREQLDSYEKQLFSLRPALIANDADATRQVSAIAEQVSSLRQEALGKNNPLLSFDKLLFVKRYTYQSSHYYTDYIDGCRLYGGNLCILSLSDGKVTDLVPELTGGIFGRYDLSWDAKRVVFDYKAGPGKGFRIYEVGIDGKGLRQLTFDPEDEEQRVEKYWLRWHKYYKHHTDDMHPCYLPDGGICFTSTRCERGILCDGPDILTTTVLYRIDADGSNMRILSQGSVSEEVPTIMNDGRILYTRWEYVDKGGSAVKCLWAMRPDGSGSVEIYGNDHAFPSFYNGRAIPNHNNQFVVIGGPHMPLGVGTVIRLDINHPIRTRRPMTYLSPEIDIKSEHGYRHKRSGRWVRDYIGPLFDDPYPLSDKFFLVSYNPDKDVRDKSAYDIYLLDEFNNRVLIHREPEFSCWVPMPLRARKKPPVLPPISAGPDTTEKKATVLLSDAYQGLDGVKRGTIKYLRVMEHVPRPWGARRFWDGDESGQQHCVISGRTHLGLKVMHGIVPVHDDGSAYFTVPADRNIFFQALDEDFMEVQRMRTFVEFKPSENRSCIGCHEYRQNAPPNKTAKALEQPPVTPGPQPGDVAPRPIYYPDDVQPIFDKHCVSCHSGAEPDGELDLTGEMSTLFSRSYDNIRKRNLVTVVDEIGPKMGNVAATPPYTWGSHTSRLVSIIRKGHENVKLSRPEFIKLVTWVDSNAQYYGSYYGRRNIKYKDHPNFRPKPTFESAVSVKPPIEEQYR